MFNIPFFYTFYIKTKFVKKEFHFYIEYYNQGCAGGKIVAVAPGKNRKVGHCRHCKLLLIFNFHTFNGPINFFLFHGDVNNQQTLINPVNEIDYNCDLNYFFLNPKKVVCCKNKYINCKYLIEKNLFLTNFRIINIVIFII